MSEFEACPVTGKLHYYCPLASANRVETGSPGQCLDWWRDTYLPAARKYAELMQGETVEFQVGDVVSLSYMGWEHVICHHHSHLSQWESTVVDIKGDGDVVLSDKFYDCDDCQWGPVLLRLIRRPRKLTVADLPEGCPITVEHPAYADSWCVFVNGINVKNWQTEHDAVTDALSTFIDPITDARNKQRKAAE